MLGAGAPVISTTPRDALAFPGVRAFVAQEHGRLSPGSTTVVAVPGLAPVRLGWTDGWLVDD